MSSMGPVPSAPQLANCPQCGQAVEPDAVRCSNCGIDQALAAALAERRMLAHKPARPAEPYLADTILPRFGEFLLKNHYITEEQLQVALVSQREASANGARPRTLGQILLEMGAVTREQLDLASIEQVRQLQDALIENNRQLERRVLQRTKELQDALRQLGEINRLKSNFVANISHELRTPLLHIKGYNALLADGTLGALSDDQREAVQVSGEAIERLEGLINDLILFASTTRGEMTLKPEALSLAALAQRAVDATVAKAERGGIKLRADIRDTLSGTVADEEKLLWVLFQLLDNAIKFTPSGGEVTVTVEARGGGMRLCVRDTGIGIPADRISELFEPFHQLDGSSTRRYGGTGLGLSLVKRIVEAHGSTVEVESEEGKGSMFAFELPAVKEQG